jgi:hypothetical protein
MLAAFQSFKTQTMATTCTFPHSALEDLPRMQHVILPNSKVSKILKVGHH